MMIPVKGILLLWLKIPNWYYNHKLQQWWNLGRNTDPKRMDQRLRAAHEQCAGLLIMQMGTGRSYVVNIMAWELQEVLRSQPEVIASLETSKMLSPHQCLCCNPLSWLQPWLNAEGTECLRDGHKAQQGAHRQLCYGLMLPRGWAQGVKITADQKTWNYFGRCWWKNAWSHQHWWRGEVGP